MNTAFETKVLRAQILLLEAERLYESEKHLLDPEIKDTLSEISEKASAIMSVASGLRPQQKVMPMIEAAPVEDVMDYQSLSKYLGRSVSALQSDVNGRRIPFVRIGEGRRGNVRFRKSAIDAWMNGLETQARK